MSKKYNLEQYEQDFALLLGLPAREQFFIIDLLQQLRNAENKKVTDEQVLNFLTVVAPMSVNAYVMSNFEDEADIKLSTAVTLFVLVGTQARTKQALITGDNTALNKLVRIWLYETKRFMRNYLDEQEAARKYIDQAQQQQFVLQMQTPEIQEAFRGVYVKSKEIIAQMTTEARRALEFEVKIKAGEVQDDNEPTS